MGRKQRKPHLHPQQNEYLLCIPHVGKQPGGVPTERQQAVVGKHARPAFLRPHQAEGLETEESLYHGHRGQRQEVSVGQSSDLQCPAN